MIDLLAFIPSFFSNIWNLFTDIIVPGLGVSFAVLTVGVFLAFFSLRVLAFMLGFSLGDGRVHYRSGSGGKKRIADDRKSDEK